MPNPLDGKRALVCGGSQGIGRACANELANLGAAVTIVARNEASLREAASALPSPGGAKHGILVADFADPPAVQAAVGDSVARGGPVHVLLNNTGGPPSGPILEAQPEAFLDAISRHVICNQLLAQTVIPGMKDSKYGRIINIISTSVLLPIKGLGVSNTTRGAVNNWARTLAGELAPFGITVNSVLPGYTDTARLSLLFEKMAASQGITPQAAKEQVVSSIPMQRLGRAEEIAAAVGFLATPAASYINGISLPVDGGRTAGQ
jgi:3-oxoacyl-[acyl-carrier protein] reductase